MIMNDNKIIVLFDGVCNLCNGFINWVIDRDTKNRFLFASLQSEVAKERLNEFGLNKQYLESIVAIKNDKLYKNSRAVLEIALSLKGIYSLLYVFIIIPTFIRDWIYKIIAKNRYKWFGVSDTCRIPTDDIKDRFL
jgi:predicted DCC family thiol-disulfide oxidoreductase YuxK